MKREHAGPSLTLPTSRGDAARRDALDAQSAEYSEWTSIDADGRLPKWLKARPSLFRRILPKREALWSTAWAVTRIGITMAHEMRNAKRRLTSHPTPTDTASASPSARLTARFAPLFAPSERAQLPLGGDTISDEGFALQRLYGTSPYQLRQVTTLPDHCRVSDSDLNGVLPADVSLDGLIREGALFTADMGNVLGDLLSHPDMVAEKARTAPTSLFFVDPASAALLPCAIQLVPETSVDASAPVFTPRSPAGTWLAAKLFANQAESIAHIAGLHTGGVYAFAQIIAAMRRTMSLRHPIHALSEPFLRHTLATTALVQLSNYPVPAWKPITGPVGRAWWRDFALDDYHLPRRLERQGVAALPLFPWRDNMLALWREYESFVSAIVGLVYADDDAVSGDDELGEWAATLHAADQCNIRCASLDATGGRFTSREQLVEVLTTFYFFVSAWHGYDAHHWPWFAWIPSAPQVFTLPPPAPGDDLSIDDVIASLADPSSKQARMQAASILAVRQHWHRSALTSGGPDGHFVPPLPAYLDGLPGAASHVRAFFESLDRCERTFTDRDRDLRAKGHLPAPPATYPSNCAGSIWYG